jgi:hypothetical protein
MFRSQAITFSSESQKGQSEHLKFMKLDQQTSNFIAITHTEATVKQGERVSGNDPEKNVGHKILISE